MIIVKNKKGQALVEFIIVLPVVIYIIMGIIDLIIISGYKSNLDSKMNEVIKIYRKDPTSMEIVSYLNKDLKNVSFKSESDNKYTYLKAEMSYDFITPGLDSLVGKNFKIKSERVILNEEE